MLELFGISPFSDAGQTETVIAAGEDSESAMAHVVNYNS